MNWQHKTINDSRVIEGYWNRDDYGIGVHTGKSGLVVFDVDLDRWDSLPPELDFLSGALWQSSRNGLGIRGHYIFQAGETFTNGNFYLSDGTVAGDIRSGNSVFIVAPTPHAKADTGGGYLWMRHGVVPELPAAAREVLKAVRPSTRAVTPVTAQDVRDFYAATASFTENPKRQYRLNGLKAMVRSVEGGTRDSVKNALRVAAKEAKCGFFPMAQAEETIREAAEKAYEARNEDIADHISESEFARLIANGISIAATLTVEECLAESNRFSDGLDRLNRSFGYKPRTSFGYKRNSR
jgi:hypothetical protein